MSEGPGCGVNISFPERWNMITKAELKKQEALELTKRKAANQLAKKERAAAEQQYFEAKKLKGAAEPSSLVETPPWQQLTVRAWSPLRLSPVAVRAVWGTLTSSRKNGPRSRVSHPCCQHCQIRCH